MSFSTELKKEISELGNLSNKEAVRYELIGYLISSNISEEKNKIKFSTENEYNINRFSRLLSNMEINNYDITVQGNLFVIRVNKNMIKDLNIDEDFNLEQVKWLIRGAYLGSGSINNPERKYHLEIGISKKNNAEKIVEYLKNYDIKSNIIEIIQQAKKEKIMLILTSLLPINIPILRYERDRKMYIKELNEWLMEMAKMNNLIFVNYYATMTFPGTDKLLDGITYDGLHPNAKGYQIMATVLKNTLKKNGIRI